MSKRMLQTVVAALAAVSVVAACSSSTSGGHPGSATKAPPVAQSQPSSAESQSSSNSAPAASGTLRGIVLLVYSPGALPGVQLSAYDPASGKVTATRSFPAAAQLPINGNYTGYLLRQDFNADFSAMIAQGPVASDGSASAGITDPSGNYKPLTAGVSGGYGSPPVKVPLAFNPLTGRLWYVNGVDAAGNTPLGSVDPQVGSASDRREFTAKHDAGFSYTASSVGAANVGYFAPDGFGPVNASFGAHLFLPGGTELSWVAAAGEFQVQAGKEGTLNGNEPWLPVTPNQTNGVPKLAVSKDSFVAFSDAAPRQLYLCTIGASEITAVPLLPESNRLVEDVGLDSTGTKLAFLSTAGDITTLYTVSLTGAHQLTTVGEIQVPSGAIAHVLAWN
jgi:hypothetical protein